MGILNDYQRWKKKVEKAIPEALIEDVKDVVEYDFQDAAVAFVYSTYSPKYYEDGSAFGRMRRYGAGGIYDISLIESHLQGSKTLVMKQTAPPNSDHPMKATAIDWVESDEGVPGAREFYAPLKQLTIPHAHKALVMGVNKRI